MIPLDQIPTETLLVVLAAVGADAWGDPADHGGRTALVRALALRARTEPTAERRLHLLLGGPTYAAVSDATDALRLAVDTNDLPGAARVVWAAARTPGAAWRAFELRARRVVVVEALLRCRATAHEVPVAAK